MSIPTRREVLGAAAFTIVPRRVLGGAGFIAPSDVVTLGLIGTGTQGLREAPPLLGSPSIRIVAVCDPCRDPVGYRDWSKTGLLDSLRAAIKKPEWMSGRENVIPGGRSVGKDLVDTAYGNKNCRAYADFREMLDKEKDLAAVKVMTPDHLHGVACMAAMKRGKACHCAQAHRQPAHGSAADHRDGSQDRRRDALYAVGLQWIDGEGDGLDSWRRHR